MSRRATLALLISAGAVCAQPPPPPPLVVVWNDFSPTVKGMTIGTSHCYFWAHSPTLAQIQIACYTGAAVLKNLIAGPGGDIGAFIIQPVALAAQTFPTLLKFSVFVATQMASVPGFVGGVTDALTEIQIPSDVVSSAGGTITWAIAPTTTPNQFSYTIIGWPGAGAFTLMKDMTGQYQSTLGSFAVVQSGVF